MESSGPALAAMVSGSSAIGGATTGIGSGSSARVDPDRAPASAMARVLSPAEEIAAGAGAAALDAMNSSSQSMVSPHAANPAVAAVAAPPGGPAMQQRQAHIPPPPPSSRIVCVPNQQAPYPHAQPSGSGKMAAKGGPVVVRHMTTVASPATSSAAAAAGGQQYVHVHKFQQQRPFVHTTFFSQGQAGGGGAMHHVRQAHPVLPIPGGGANPRHPPPKGGQRIPHPVSSPRYVNAGQAAGGVMSASASPQLHKPQGGIHHFRVTSNGTIIGKSPTWLQVGQGSSSMGELQTRDRPDALSVIINDRKVRLVSEADKSSLYSLCRRWVRNDVPRKDQHQVGCWDCVVPLPRPLSAAEVEQIEPSPEEEDGDDSDEVLKADYPVEKLTTTELLDQHIGHFKNVRKRSREEIKQRIARYRPRLSLCLQRDYT